MLGPAASVLALVGVAILAGYLGQLAFRRFRISDMLVLLAVGFTLGPVFGLLDASYLRAAMPVLGPLGLVIILFEGGLELRWDELRRHGWGAVAFTIASWTLTVGALMLPLHYLVGLTWPLALLLACAVGATGIVAVIPILARVKASPQARVWLTVETAIGDLLSAVSVVALATMYLEGGSPIRFGSTLGVQVVLGGAVGFLGGLAWSRLLFHVKERAHAYGLTLGGLLLAYGATEALGGSGYLCALVFGLVVGNAPALVARGGIPALDALSERSRNQQSEIIFLLRSLYFLYLGLLVGREALTPASGAAMLGVVAAMLLARLVAVGLTFRVREPGDPDTRLLLIGMMPRAMAAAVIASIPAALGVPGTEGFLTITLLVIVGADIATTVGLYVYERRRPRLAGVRDAALASE